MLFSFTSFVAATAISFLPAIEASALIKRTSDDFLPSCTDFTPFTYAGCFSDPTNNPSALNFRATILPLETMTVNTCVAFCKGNGYRYAGIEYYGLCFCGSTVNGPQIAETECNYPCAGNKSEVCGGTNIISVYQDPTFLPAEETDITEYISLGCYSEGPNGRTLAWKQDEVDGDTLTVQSCLTACNEEAYPFAGVEFGKECWCGVVLGNGTVALDASECDFPCAGNPEQSCGGSRKLNLYVAKDLESREPCKHGEPPVSSSTTTSATTTEVISSTTTQVVTTTTPVVTTTTTTSPVVTSTTTSKSLTTTTKIVTTTTPSPSTTVALCTSTTKIAPEPTCEYKCGKWCSKPLPPFTNKDECKTAVSNCVLQLTSCFLQAGFPDNLKCFKYADWCDDVSSYCGSSCPGSKCNWPSCKIKYPPAPPPTQPTPVTSTTVFPCKTTTTAKTTTKVVTTTSSSVVPVPTHSCICEQPNNPKKGYTKDKPVAGIALPCLTCNNIQSDYRSGNIFKLYNNPDSSRCPSYPAPSPGCKKACDNQYTACVNVYAEECRNKWWRRDERMEKRTLFGGYDYDSYDGAMEKCRSQWKDCYAVNEGKKEGGKCTVWNSGW